MINTNEILSLNVEGGMMFQTKDNKLVSLEQAQAGCLQGKVVNIDVKQKVAKALFGSEKIGTTEIKAAIKILVLSIENVNYASQVPLATEDKNKLVKMLETVLEKPTRKKRKKK